jgi:hypothetical protein
MPETDPILKVDARGRVWTPRAQREAALDAFERSGLPATKFAEHIGVKYSTFANWAQKRRKLRAAQNMLPLDRSAPAGLRWVEASISTDAARPLQVHLPGGAQLEVSDAGQAMLAAQLLRALAAGGAPC